VSELVLHFRLPAAGWPRATFRGDHAHRRGRLFVGDELIVDAPARADLERGVHGRLPGDTREVELRVVREGATPRVLVHLDGVAALEESQMRIPASRSAWIHALLALAASAAGFIAGYLYLGRAAELAVASAQSVHATKMAVHMAGWHLLLTFTLLPASVWGQRAGIRAVQGVSLLFFLIHAGIALANTGEAVVAGAFWIGFWNAASGAFFFAAVVYGNVAWRDMDPVAPLLAGAPRFAGAGIPAPTPPHA
jgi:hypothetical protein